MTASCLPFSTLIAMSRPPENKQSTTKQSWFRRILPHKRRASPASQYPDAPDAQHTDSDAPSTSVNRPSPLPVSPAQRTCVDLVRSNVIVNQPSTGSGPTGIGEHIGHASCIDRHQHGPQIITLRFSTGDQEILLRL